MRHALAALLLLLPLALPPAGANHVPLNVFTVEVPQPGAEGHQWVCYGAAKTSLQMGTTCQLWCATDWGCAIFMEDLDFQRLPFEVTFLNAQRVWEHRASRADGFVCLYYWELWDLHFTLHPTSRGAGSMAWAYAVKDEGQFCSF